MNYQPDMTEAVDLDIKHKTKQNICLYYAVLSFLCSRVITCCEAAVLSWLSCVGCFLVFATFPYGAWGWVWYLIVPIPDLCLPFTYSIVLPK